MALYQKSKPQQMDDSEKIYYSIGEVAESLHVKKTVKVTENTLKKTLKRYV